MLLSFDEIVCTVLSSSSDEISRTESAIKDCFEFIDDWAESGDHDCTVLVYNDCTESGVDVRIEFDLENDSEGGDINNGGLSIN